MNNLDGLVDDGAVLLGVLLLVDHRLVLGLVVGRRRQGRRVLVNWMNGTIRERERERIVVAFIWVGSECDFRGHLTIICIALIPGIVHSLLHGRTKGPIQDCVKM